MQKLALFIFPFTLPMVPEMPNKQIVCRRVLLHVFGLCQSFPSCIALPNDDYFTMLIGISASLCQPEGCSWHEGFLLQFFPIQKDGLFRTTRYPFSKSKGQLTRLRPSTRARLHFFPTCVLALH